MFLCSPCFPTQPELICMETICFVKRENSYSQQKVLSPRIERKWLGFTKCPVGFNWITQVEGQHKWKSRRFNYLARIRYLFSTCSEFWIMVQVCIPLPTLRLDRCQPQLHLASDALELKWCSGMSMRCRHRVKKEAKRWASTWDFTVWTVPLPATVLGRRLLMRTHESSTVTV